MDSTPPRSKLSCKDIKFKTGIKRDEFFDSPQLVVSSSSHHQPMDQESDYSPIYFPSTQEASDEIDVLWDWHSPQTSQRRRKKQKRLLPVQSPKIPIKRYPSNNQNQNLEKLRDELRALKEELALPDDERCLCVSPQQEMEYKRLEDNNLVLKEEQECQLAQFDDMFDDSIDEQLLLFSQQIEKDVEKSADTKENKDSFSRICNNSEIDSLINKYSNKNLGQSKKITTNDSFDLALKNFNIEDTKKPNNLNSSSTQNNTSLQRSVSEHKFCNDKINGTQRISGKMEFHRTKSFELEAVKHSQIHLSKSTLEEIERKRLEAKARLEAKKKLNCTNTIISPTKCSPEEIERKRLQALAKREAKRLQEIVEKNRQEALKRLQLSRMKKANLVKSTLTKRL